MNKPIKWAAAVLLLSPLAVRAIQPLVSDDTGTQGGGDWQVEASAAQASRQGADARQRQWNATLMRGLTEAMDLYIGLPYTQCGAGCSGWNDAALGLKWRLAEWGRFSLAVKPEITLPTGNWRRGLGTERAGAGATVAGQWQSGPWTLLANAGLAWQPNRQGDRRAIWRVSGAALYRVTGKLQMALDAVVERNSSPGAASPPAFLMAAAIYSPTDWLDLNKAVKRDPRTHLRSAANNWDYWTLLPEALHQITVVMSDRGIPASYRHMHGFSSHTYSFWNAQGQRFWVKMHFKTRQGIKNLTDAEAAELVGQDRESHQRDLYEAIARGDFPKWTMYVQVMPEADAEKYRLHPFDLTKVWYKADYPLIEVGEFELNRNPENFFLDVEQSAFSPANLVPGIGVSPDRMLQARLFNYADAQRYRLGVNHQQIPVNRARCPVHSNHRDGMGRVDANYGGLPHYEPNSFGQWQAQPQFEEPPLKIHGDVRFWSQHKDDGNYFEQPRKLFQSMTPAQQQALFGNTARAMGDAPEFIKRRHIRNCHAADPAYGAGVAKALGIDLQKALASKKDDPMHGNPLVALPA